MFEWNCGRIRLGWCDCIFIGEGSKDELVFVFDDNKQQLLHMISISIIWNFTFTIFTQHHTLRTIDDTSTSGFWYFQKTMVSVTTTSLDFTMPTNKTKLSFLWQLQSKTDGFNDFVSNIVLRVLAAKQAALPPCEFVIDQDVNKLFPCRRPLPRVDIH